MENIENDIITSFGSFKKEMNTNEIEDFKSNWVQCFNGYANNLGRIQLCGTYIYICPPRMGESWWKPERARVGVFGYNGVELGVFESDNGCKTNGIYYPIIRFYNQLNACNMGGNYGYNCGQGNNYSIPFTNDMLVLTDKLLLETIRKSFEYVKIFD